VEITGPVSTDAYPVLMVYNPDELEEVRGGRRVDFTVDPVHVMNAQQRFGLKTAPLAGVGSAKTLGGAYFDKVSQKLYVCAPQADTSVPGLFQPLVHVFQLG
jgi:hypothetical protein